MNVNKNLHNISVLTEFSRNFEEEQTETVISKLVNKIYEACNNVNADIGGTSSTQQQSQTQTPQNEDESSESSSSTSIPSSLSGSTTLEQKKEQQTPTVYQVDTSQGRTSLNVIKRISNLIALRDKDLSDYKNTELKRLWMPDDKSRECYDCALKFTTFRRKHHCKICCYFFGCILDLITVNSDLNFKFLKHFF